MSVSSSCRAVVAACVALAAAGPALAQGQGAVEVRFNANAAVREHAVMVSLVSNGAVFRQSETVVPTSRRFDAVPAGLYDVRVEGDGMVTAVKRGVQVFDGQTLNLQFVLQPGQGVRIVEYATGGLAREEVAARLARLDSAVAELQRTATPRRN